MIIQSNMTIIWKCLLNLRNLVLFSQYLFSVTDDTQKLLTDIEHLQERAITATSHLASFEWPRSLSTATVWPLLSGHAL